MKTTREAMTIESFLRRAKEIHGDKYTYEQTVIDNKSRSVVVITCGAHGDFRQRADGHLEGKGCPLCAVQKRTGEKPATTAEFIEKAKSVHGDLYDYTSTVYKNSRTKVTVVCRMHGAFGIRPDSHTWQKAGCPQCAQDARTAFFADDTDTFIAKAKVIHGDRYDYSCTTYVRSNRKVTIACVTHGIFEVAPNKHITEEQGCPWCSDSISKGERAIAAYLDMAGTHYIRQAWFHGLRTTRPLLFDFFLPVQGVLIEYHGEQHYASRDFYGGERGLERQKWRDTLKSQWAADNNYRLVVIPYTVKPSLVAQHLDNVLGGSNEPE